LFADHPWLGCGPDTFALAFGQQRTAAYWQTEWGVTPTRAHNEIIHLLATQGLLGGSALLLLLVGGVSAGVRAWRRAPSEARPLVAAVALGVIGFFIQDLFSFTMAGGGTLLVVCAALLSRWGGDETMPEPGSNGRSNLGLVGTLLGAAG